MNYRVIAAMLFACSAASPTAAAQVTLTIGDNDGYGFGTTVVPDNGEDIPFTPFSPFGPDNRSEAERTDTDGAQFTDLHALLGGLLPNPIFFRFPLTSEILAAELTIDMASFQAGTWGQHEVSLNGVVSPGFLNFQDGPFNSVVRELTLSDDAVERASAAGELYISIRNPGIGDAIAFDFLRLEATELIKGDITRDGIVDAADAAILFENWGTVSDGNHLADINHDEIVDAADAGILFENWSGDTSVPTSIPEPATRMLLMSALVTLGRFWRRSSEACATR